MNREPRMLLQILDARARRQAVREQLITKIENLADQNEKLDREIEELGLGSLLKKTAKKVLGRGDKKPDFEKKHPRGKDGRFADASGATKEEKDYNEVEYQKWSEVIAVIDAETKRLREEEKKIRTDPNRRPLSVAYLDKRVDLDERIKANIKKSKKVKNQGPRRFSGDGAKNRANFIK